MNVGFSVGTLATSPAVDGDDAVVKTDYDAKGAAQKAHDEDGPGFSWLKRSTRVGRPPRARSARVSARRQPGCA